MVSGILMSSNIELISALVSQSKFSDELLQLIAKRYKPIYNAIFHHHSTRGKKMDFVKYRYLVDLYMDNAVEIYVKSSVQSGKSEWAVVDHLCKAEMGLTVLYVLPDDKLRTRFTRNRVDKMFHTVPHYAKMYADGVGGSKNVNLKHYGNGTIVYANSGSANDFKELPADALYLDEYDQMNMEIVESAEDRLSSSDFKLVRYIANPTITGFGIDAKIQKTDQKFWNIKCQSCNHWQKIDFFKNVIETDNDGLFQLRDRDWSLDIRRDIFCYCEKCFEKIDRLSSTSEWIAKYPERIKSGYQISKLFSPHNTLSEVWDKFSDAAGNETKMQVVYNSDLGECYEATGSRLTPEILNSCKAEYLMPNECPFPCVMGIDVGSFLDVVINRVHDDGDMQLVGLFRLKEPEEIDNLLLRYNIKSFVIDAMPETRLSLKVCNKFPSIAYMCRYVEGKLDEIKGLRKATVQESTRFEIQADRLLIMDNVMEKFMTGKYLLPKNADSLMKGKFYEMLCAPVRTWVSDGGTDGRYVYTKSEDHFFHAYNYSLLARYQMRDFTVRFLDGNSKTPDDAIRTRMLKEQNIVIPATIPPHLVDYYKGIIAREKKMQGKD